MDAVIALCGMVVGGFLGFGGECILRVQAQKNRAKQVARSFLGEIEGLVSIIEFRSGTESVEPGLTT